MPNCNCSVTCTSGASAYMMSKAVENKKKSIINGWVKEGITFAIKRKEYVPEKEEPDKKTIKFI